MKTMLKLLKKPWHFKRTPPQRINIVSVALLRGLLLMMMCMCRRWWWTTMPNVQKAIQVNRKISLITVSWINFSTFIKNTIDIKSDNNNRSYSNERELVEIKLRIDKNARWEKKSFSFIQFNNKWRPQSVSCARSVFRLLLITHKIHKNVRNWFIALYSIRGVFYLRKKYFSRFLQIPKTVQRDQRTKNATVEPHRLHIYSTVWVRWSGQSLKWD